MTEYLIAGFYVNSERSSCNFIFIDAASLMEGANWYL